ncbi:EamA family transporter [Arsenicicoccus sp. MKL-02]|uniref:EamA family transporter n=1 Tax=Arsenicicoccus cauae TaxID=2663847 RepID=A0A6I3I9G0_9MICO|nr:DMT family transporter [Arsenicicoccus cauae]MTB72814.1 EamA family transporter [Arsenicicoccus cauae]
MLRGYLLVLISAVGFGVNPLLATAAYRAGVGVPTVLLYRFAVAAAVLWALCASRGVVRPLSRCAVAGLTIAALAYVLQAATYFYAVQQISAGLAALLLYLYPCLVALVTALVARVFPSRAVVLSLVLSFAGIGLALGRVSGAGSLPGVLAGVATALCYTAYVLLTDHLGATVPPLPASAWVCTLATGFVMVVTSVTGTFDPAQALRAPWAVAGVGLAGGALAIATFFAGVAVVGATQASIVSTVEPIISVVGSALLLGAAMTGSQWVGAATVLAGSAVAVLAHARQDDVVEEVAMEGTQVHGRPRRAPQG